MGGGAGVGTGRTCKAQLNIIKDPNTQFVCILSKCVKTIVAASNDVAQVRKCSKRRGDLSNLPHFQLYVLYILYMHMYVCGTAPLTVGNGY